MYWIYTLGETFLSKEWKRLFLYSALLILAWELTALAVRNPI